MGAHIHVSHPHHVHAEIDLCRGNVGMSQHLLHTSHIRPVLQHMDGEGMSIFVNARYLLDVLKVVDDDEVMLEFENGLKPYIIRPVEGEDYVYMIVPLNIRE